MSGAGLKTWACRCSLQRQLDAQTHCAVCGETRPVTSAFQQALDARAAKRPLDLEEYFRRHHARDAVDHTVRVQRCDGGAVLIRIQPTDDDSQALHLVVDENDLTVVYA